MRQIFSGCDHLGQVVIIRLYVHNTDTVTKQLLGDQQAHHGDPRRVRQVDRRHLLPHPVLPVINVVTPHLQYTPQYVL